MDDDDDGDVDDDDPYIQSWKSWQPGGRRHYITHIWLQLFGPELQAPTAQHLKPVLLVVDFLQKIFVGHTLPEIPPPPAIGAKGPLVGDKLSLIVYDSLVLVAATLLPVVGIKAFPAHPIEVVHHVDLIQYIFVRHTLPEITPTLAPVASLP